MTVKKRLIEICKNKGMDEDTAVEIVQLAIPEIEKKTSGYQYRWNESEEQYPSPFFDTMFFTVKEVARKWIEENRPEAWFRGEFE